MASNYSQVITTSKETSESALEAQFNLATQAIRTGGRKIDIVSRFNDLARQGADKYKKWLQRGSLATGLAIAALGVGAVPAFALMGAGTYLSGKKGEKEAQKKFNKTNYLKDTTKKLMSEYEKKTQSTAVQNAVLAGISASGAEKASTRAMTKGADEVNKKNLLSKLSSRPSYKSSLYGGGTGDIATSLGGKFVEGDVLKQMYRNLGYHAEGWTRAFGDSPFKAGSFISGKFGGKNEGYPSTSASKYTGVIHDETNLASDKDNFMMAINFDPLTGEYK